MQRHKPLAEPGKLRFQMGLQQVQYARHGGQHGDALCADRLNQAPRLQAVFEMNLGGHQRWNPQPHELPEDVTQGQGMQEAQGMKDTFIG